MLHRNGSLDVKANLWKFSNAIFVARTFWFILWLVISFLLLLTSPLFFGGGEERAPDRAQHRMPKHPIPSPLFFFGEHKGKNRSSWCLWVKRQRNDASGTALRTQLVWAGQHWRRDHVSLNTRYHCPKLTVELLCCCLSHSFEKKKHQPKSTTSSTKLKQSKSHSEDRLEWPSDVRSHRLEKLNLNLKKKKYLVRAKL